MKFANDRCRPGVESPQPETIRKGVQPIPLAIASFTAWVRLETPIFL